MEDNAHDFDGEYASFNGTVKTLTLNVVFRQGVGEPETMDYELVQEMGGDGSQGQSVENCAPNWLPGPEEYNYNMLDPRNEYDLPPSNLQYNNDLRAWVEDYPSRTVGTPIRQATRDEMAKWVWGEPGDIGQLADPDNFEVAEFLLQSGLSVKEREKFLRLKKLEGRAPWPSNHLMMKDVDTLPRRTKWEAKYYEIEGPKSIEKLVFWHRNTADVFRELFGILALKGRYRFRPERHYLSRDMKNRRYGEAWTADAWWKVQQMIQDEFATVGRYIIASDQTPLTGFCGSKKAHPVYFSIANLSKEIRRTHSHRAMVLVGYLPIPTLDCEPNSKAARELRDKLFNDCIRDLLKPLTDAERVGMEVVCADGGVRRVYPTLSSTIADYPEQCRNACTTGSYCPICVVPRDKRGDLNQNIPLRQRIPTLKAISEHRAEGSPNFEDWGLRDQWPWWSRHTYIDIATMHTPDLLHQCHKGVFKDHLAKYIPSIIGAQEMDQRYQLMPRHHGIRHFKRGISKLSRATGREAKEMMKVFLPVAADAGPKVVDATRGLLKFMYLAHSSTLTEDELCEMDKQLATFHSQKSVFDEWLKTKRKFHNIPKFHSLQHYTHAIRMLGTPDGYNTEAPERLHIDLTKAGFNASNKIDDTELEQMAEYIQRMDSLALHRAYLNYIDRPEGDDEGDDWRDGWEDLDSLDDDEFSSGSDGEEMEGSELGSNGYSDSDEDSEGNLDDLTAGCVVQRVMDRTDFREDRDGQGAAFDNDGGGLEIHYPNPEVATAKQCNKLVTIDYLIKTHSAINLPSDISQFLKRLDPNLSSVVLPLDTRLHVWTIARLFHTPLPFKPLEPTHVETIRARPPKVDRIGRVSRLGQYDTVLVLSYPEKTGIHRYRAARVRAIFELPSQFKHLCPQQLVYVEWFNPFNPSLLKYWETYSTTRAVDQAQRTRTSVIPLSSIRLACHLGPRFNTIDEEFQPRLDTDIFDVCRSFILNQFASYYVFDLLEHWEKDVLVTIAHGPPRVLIDLPESETGSLPRLSVHTVRKELQRPALLRLPLISPNFSSDSDRNLLGLSHTRTSSFSSRSVSPFRPASPTKIPASGTESFVSGSHRSAGSQIFGGSQMYRSDGGCETKTARRGASDTYRSETARTGAGETYRSQTPTYRSETPRSGTRTYRSGAGSDTYRSGGGSQTYRSDGGSEVESEHYESEDAGSQTYWSDGGSQTYRSDNESDAGLSVPPSETARSTGSETARSQTYRSDGGSNTYRTETYRAPSEAPTAHSATETYRSQSRSQSHPRSVASGTYTAGSETYRSEGSYHSGSKTYRTHGSDTYRESKSKSESRAQTPCPDTYTDTESETYHAGSGIEGGLSGFASQLYPHESDAETVTGRSSPHSRSEAGFSQGRAEAGFSQSRSEGMYSQCRSEGSYSQGRSEGTHSPTRSHVSSNQGRSEGGQSQGWAAYLQGSSTYLRGQGLQAYALTYTQDTSTYVAEDYTKGSEAYSHKESETQGLRTPPPVPPKSPNTPRGVRTPNTLKQAMSPVTPNTPNPTAEDKFADWQDRTPKAAKRLELLILRSQTGVMTPCTASGRYGKALSKASTAPTSAKGLMRQRMSREVVTSVPVPSESKSITLGHHGHGQESMRISALWCLNVHAPPPFEWLRTQAVLYPNVLILTWIAPTGGHGAVPLDLVNYTEVRSAPLHPSARDDVGSVAPRLQTADLVETLCPFQLLYTDGVGRLGMDTAKERVRWVGSIWDVLATIAHGPPRVLANLSDSEGAATTSFVAPAAYIANTSSILPYLPLETADNMPVASLAPLSRAPSLH
ncbi:Zn-finger protein, partial [Rhizoctonia solani]